MRGRWNQKPKAKTCMKASLGSEKIEKEIFQNSLFKIL